MAALRGDLSRRGDLVVRHHPQRVIPARDLDALSPVDATAELELDSHGGRDIDVFLDHRPVDRVVHVTDDVEVGKPGGPRRSRCAVRYTAVRQPRVDGPAARGLAVRIGKAGPELLRPATGEIDMDPEAD